MLICLISNLLKVNKYEYFQMFNYDFLMLSLKTFYIKLQFSLNFSIFGNLPGLIEWVNTRFQSSQGK